MSTYNGKCHCGQTEWTVKLGNDEASHILCHCNTCKVLSGGAYTLNQIIPKSDFELVKGNLKAYTYYGDSGKAVNCYYCPNCTVQGPDKIVVRTVLLEGGNQLKPVAEIYGKVRLSWQPEVATTHETLPPE